MESLKNCTYAEKCIELYSGAISIDFDNKAVFINFDNEHRMFDGWTNDIKVTLSHKPHTVEASNEEAKVLASLKSTMLIINQGDETYTKNISDVAIEPFLNGVTDAGYKWDVEKDLSARSFVITAND